MTAAVQAYVSRASARFTQRLQAEAERLESLGRALQDILGSPEELADKALAAQVPALSPWDELVGPFVRSEGVQARLGISRQAVAAKAARRRLLRAFTADHVALFPLWQFEGDHLVPGLAEVLAVFPEEAVDGWTVAGWLRSSDPDLGAAPLDVLKRGEAGAQSVLAAARPAALALAT